MSQNFSKNNQKQEKVISAGRMGALECHLVNGKLISSSPAISPLLDNPLQSIAPDQVYSRARISTPMVRRGYLENPDNPQGVRGQDDYLPLSWDDAYELIDFQHKKIRKQYGASSIFAGAYGWRSSGVLHRAQTLLQRYMSMAGGYVSHWGNYSTGAVQVILPFVLGSDEVNQQQTSYPVVLEHSDVVVFWGANPRTTLQVAWSAADPQGFDFLNKLKKSGKKIIAIDPRRSETIDFFGDDIEWISLNPCSDVALMLAMAYVLVEKNKHDIAFLNRYTEGFERFEPYLLGTTDNIPKTPHWAQSITGVSADKIEALALLFCEHRTMFIAGWAMQRQQYGEQTHWMLATLAAMLGQIGTAGGGFSFSFRLGFGPQKERTDFYLAGMSSHIDENWLAKENQQGAVAHIPVARLVDALENPNQSYQYNGQSLVYPELKMIWWAGGANFTHHQDTLRLIKAWQKPQCIIVSEIYWTAAAKHADIVLPISTSFERNDMTMQGDVGDRFLVPMKKVVAEQALARSDFQVFTDLAERLQERGGDIFCEGRDEQAWLEHFYNLSASAYLKGDDARTLPTFDDFWQDNQPIEIKVPAGKPDFIRFAAFREDPLKAPLATPSGKIEIYSSALAELNLSDCPAHPSWLAPNEYLGHANLNQLHLLSPHSAYRLHSQFNDCSLRKRYAISDKEPVIIHSQDAVKRGIKTGDVVRLFNQRGQVLAGALVCDDIKQGVLCLHQGAWPDLDFKTQCCKNGAANVLTQDISSSSLANACSANSTLVEIEKYQGPTLTLTAFDPPQGALV